ncbi:MAG: TonB-dependent siderophore receptor [Colwellia sp.]
MTTKTNLSCLANIKPSALAIAITAAIPFVSAQAEEIKELATAHVTSTDEDSYKIDKSSSYKFTQPLVDTPKTISIISQAVMQDRGIDSLADALRNVPGISMAAGEGGDPTGDSMYIRGFNSKNSISIDGIRDIAGYTRDTYNTESIEVSKGPGSAVTGRGAAGGSINMNTKSAVLDSFTDVSLRLGTENDYRGQVDSNIIVGDTSAVRINLVADDGEVAGRDAVENSKMAIALAFATGIDTNSRFSVKAEYQKQDNLPDYGLPWVPNYAAYDDRQLADGLISGEPDVDFNNFYGNVNRDYEDIVAQSITLQYEYDVSENTTLRALARTGSVTRESMVTAPRFAYTEDADGNRLYGDPLVIRLDDEKGRDTEDSMAILQVDLIGSYQLGNMQHDIVTGFEISQEKFDRWNLDAVVEDNLATGDVFNDYYNPDPYMPFTGQYARGQKSNEATGDTTAFYIFDTVTLNEQWQVSAGLRYDNFSTEYYPDLDEDEDSDKKLVSDDSELSWNFGVVYKPTSNGSIYIAAGNSFESSADDLTASTRGNAADLDPEETISYEIGTKWELLNGRVLTSAAIFRTEKNNAKTDDPFAEDDRAETLDGKQRVQGLELSIVGMVNDQISITGAYTYQNSEVLEAAGDDARMIGYELARTPKHSMSLWGNYEVSEDLSAGLGMQYVGDRYNSTDPLGREKAAGYVIFDLMVAYQVTDDFKVQLNASNLTDEDYADKVGGGHFVPGDGRYASLTASYSF